MYQMRNLLRIAHASGELEKEYEKRPEQAKNCDELHRRTACSPGRLQHYAASRTCTECNKRANLEG